MRALALLFLFCTSCRTSAHGGDAASPSAPATATIPTATNHPSSTSLGLSPQGERALETVISATGYGGTATGAAGTPTPVVAALRTLLREPHAAAAFEFAIDHGTLPGKLTALTGLWSIDRARFDARIAPFKASRELVNVLYDGCMPGGDPTPAGEIVERPNGVRLGPTESLYDWSVKNPGKAVTFDIVGGGYPLTFKGPPPVQQK